MKKPDLARVLMVAGMGELFVKNMATDR